MTRYSSPDHRGIEADSPRAAALVFANRTARARYGRAGYCRTLRLDCWTGDGRSFHYETFIGRDVGNNSCQGTNVWIYVTAHPDADTGETKVPMTAYMPEAGI